MSPHSIRSYYDQNTRLFLAFGSGRDVSSIHRAVWADGARTLDEALNVTHQRILAEVPGRRVADLGCGVGASLFHILPQMEQPAFGLGLTISPVQAQLAHTAAHQRGMGAQCLIAEGDFLSVPLKDESLDAVYSVEAFCHALEPASYFHEAARLLRPGGRLVIVDDFRAERAERAERDLSAAETHWLDAFQAGWHVPGICSPLQAVEWAAAAGLSLRRDDDLSPYLRLRALHDSFARFLLKAGQVLPLSHAILPSMLGSMALQQCLQRGIIQYHFMVFEKGVSS
jgi:SAM-dependent methyltransferase